MIHRFHKHTLFKTIYTKKHIQGSDSDTKISSLFYKPNYSIN